MGSLATMPAMLAMHAPDGMFSMPVNIVFGVVVLGLLAVAAAALARRHDHRLVPVMGIMAALVFAGQMVNFPIAAGTTGHLLGGTLAAILLGPWAATIVLTTVICFQALLADGGVTVLGPNIFNMGVIGTCMAYFIHRAAVGRAVHQPARVVAAAFFAGWVAVVLASVFASLQLAVSGTVSLERALPAMVGVHMLIGIGEGLITAGVIAFVLKTRPDLLYDAAGTPAGRPVGRPAVLFGLTGALVIALFLSLLPRLWDHPDGLERIGQDQGFVFEEPQLAADGSLQTLPAYPLGVRLALVDGRVTATHQYDPRATSVLPGDVVTQIGPDPITDLGSAAAALGYDREAARFGVQPGQVIALSVEREGKPLTLALHAAGTPRAGTLSPLVALLPNYTVPGVHGLISTSLAGAIGTVVMFAVSFFVGRALMRPSRLARTVSPDPRHA